MRIFPEMCARTLWPFSSSTRNMAFGSGSTTVPSRTIASSLGLGSGDLLAERSSDVAPDGSRAWGAGRQGRRGMVSRGAGEAKPALPHLGSVVSLFRRRSMWVVRWHDPPSDGHLVDR